MNEIVNKFLLTSDKFMPKMHLKQPGFTYTACGPFTKNKKRIQKFNKTGDKNHIFLNELDKACLQHHMVYGDFKDLKRETFFNKVLRHKAFNIAKYLKHDGYQKELASIVYKFFDKKSTGSGIANNKTKQNTQLAEELHKPIIGNFKKRTVYFGFKGNIGGADLPDMQLVSNFNKKFICLLCVIDIFRKCAWVVLLKDKKSVSIVNAFQKILKESNRPPNEIWIDKRSEFYNNFFKKWLKDTDIEMCSTHSEENLLLLSNLVELQRLKLTNT